MYHKRTLAGWYSIVYHFIVIMVEYNENVFLAEQSSYLEDIGERFPWRQGHRKVTDTRNSGLQMKNNLHPVLQ